MPPKRRKKSSEEIPPWGWWVIGGVILLIFSTVLGMMKGTVVAFLPITLVAMVLLIRPAIKAFKASAEEQKNSLAAIQKKENDREIAQDKKDRANIEQKARREQREKINKEYDLIPLSQRKPSCPFCRCDMERRSKSTDSAGGCLIVILGLCLTPILIGIPLIFVGIHYMSKKRTAVICPRCGIENSRTF